MLLLFRNTDQDADDFLDSEGPYNEIPPPRYCYNHGKKCPGNDGTSCYMVPYGLYGICRKTRIFPKLKYCDEMCFRDNECYSGQGLLYLVTLSSVKHMTPHAP